MAEKLVLSDKPDLVLTRFAYTPLGTFGELQAGDARLNTVERPWRDNQEFVSCIPEGRYRCLPRFFNKGKYPAIGILDVPGRSHILFHRANVPRHVTGCIGVGASLGVLGGEWAVLDSRWAFDLFMKHWGGRDFTLEIQGPPPAVLESRTDRLERV